MHELSIAQSLLDIVLEEGHRHQLKAVKLIKVQVGALAAVVPEALNFCFEMLSQDTIAAGVRLEIESVPVVIRCRQCETVSAVEDHVFLCPNCHESSVEMVSGRELTLASIEGETGE